MYRWHTACTMHLPYNMQAYTKYTNINIHATPCFATRKAKAWLCVARPGNAATAAQRATVDGRICRYTHSSAGHPSRRCIGAVQMKASDPDFEYPMSTP